MIHRSLIGQEKALTLKLNVLLFISGITNIHLASFLGGCYTD